MVNLLDMTVEQLNVLYRDVSNELIKRERIAQAKAKYEAALKEYRQLLAVTEHESIIED